MTVRRGGNLLYRVHKNKCLNKQYLRVKIMVTKIYFIKLLLYVYLILIKCCQLI